MYKLLRLVQVTGKKETSEIAVVLKSFLPCGAKWGSHYITQIHLQLLGPVELHPWIIGFSNSWEERCK